MTPFRITVRRTVGYVRNVYSTAFVTGAFLAASAAFFSLGFHAAEGGRQTVALIWALAVSPLLPVLAAFLGMDVWSEERRTGRLDVLLASPVSEVDLVLGKFVGTWIVSLLAMALSLLSTVVLLRVYAPACVLAPGPLLAAFFVLALQGALWCAISSALSAVFRRAAIAACATVFLLVALPRGIWAMLLAGSVRGRSAYGDMPLDAHVVDFVSGVVSGGTVFGYLALTVLALFASVGFVELRRLVGRGAVRRRVSVFLSLGLASVLALLAIFLVVRLDFVFDIPLSGRVRYSDRTLDILGDAHGDIAITCFLSRSDSRFRLITHSLRSLAREAQSRGGARLNLRFVDPAWDVGEAARLVRAGIKPGQVVFSYGRRSTVLSVDEGLGERICATAIQRLTMPPQRRCVRWTRGHGEAAFDDYGPFGLSDIARELAQGGYQNQPLDLSVDAPIPSDCALIVVAGSRGEFSRAELARVDAYLKQGGRMLVLTETAETVGLSALLPRWGLRVLPFAGSGRTVSGGDVIVSDFGDHPVTAPLKGLNVLLDHPVSFAPSAAAESPIAADRVVFSALARSGSECVAALLERSAGEDLGLRPMRLAAIGSLTFVMNARLAEQANANRDLFLNVIAYLAGTDAVTSGGQDGDRLVTGMDRGARRRLAVAGIGVVPGTVGLVMVLVAFRRRRRS